MPYYTQLKKRPNESAESKTRRERVAGRLIDIRDAMTKHFEDSGSEFDTRKTARIATWNLREFGGSKYGGRSYEEIYYIAEIISRFDIVALQEVRGDLKEFYDLTRILGPDWDYVATDVTDGAAGNGERMVFLFNRRHVQFRNIAGELTLKEGGKIRAAFGERINLGNTMEITIPANSATLSGTYDARVKKAKDGSHKLAADLEIPLPIGSVLNLPEGASAVLTKGNKVTKTGRGRASVTIPNEITGDKYRLRFPHGSFDNSMRQFARTPYLLSFQAGWLKINLCTVHIYYGDASDKKKIEQRRCEIEELTKALAAKAKSEFKFDDKAFMGVLGDFNIIGKGHPTMEALKSNQFEIPEKLQTIPGSNVARDKAYDQIAFWKPSRISGYARLEVGAANIFDFFEHVFTDDDASTYAGETDNGLKSVKSYRTWRTYKMSDHLPMWVELKTDFSEAYLKRIESGEA